MHQVPLFRLRRCTAPGSHPVRGSASVKIRAISGPAVPPKPRQALFALVSDALPLYRQQTKNLLVSYSPKRLGFFWTSEKRRLTWTSSCQAPLVRPDHDVHRPQGADLAVGSMVAATRRGAASEDGTSGVAGPSGQRGGSGAASGTAMYTVLLGEYERTGANRLIRLRAVR
jgi:hypothetical protein